MSLGFLNSVGTKLLKVLVRISARRIHLHLHIHLILELRVLLQVGGRRAYSTISGLVSIDCCDGIADLMHILGAWSFQASFILFR